MWGRHPPPANFFILRVCDRFTGWQQPVRPPGFYVRGGSWDYTHHNARCAYRNMNHPDNRNNNLGFRVVLRSPHVLPALLLAGFCSRSARRCPAAAQARRVFRQCLRRRASARAGRGEGRRTAPGRSGPLAGFAAQRYAGRRWRRAHIETGAGQAAHRCAARHALPRTHSCSGVIAFRCGARLPQPPAQQPPHASHHAAGVLVGA